MAEKNDTDLDLESVEQRIKKTGRRLRISSVMVVLLLLAAIAVSFYKFMLVYIKPNEYGIMQVKIGVERGIQEKVYPSGLNVVVPFMWAMHRFPKGRQILELTNFPGTASGRPASKAAHIQTSDGFFVDVDVSIIYHIRDPYKVFTTIGPGDLYEDNGIIPKAEPALKATLGELTTEEFYNSPLRVEKAVAARDMLNRELEPKGIYVDHVLVRYFRYSDEIQRNIEEKKLKDQLVFKNQAEARAAAEVAVLKRIEEEGRATVSVELEKGKAYVTRKGAEKDLYVRKKRADADLLVQLAEAEKVRLKNEALRGKGAAKMVGMKMADVYKGLDVVILPSDGPGGVNPLDLSNTLELFDVREGGTR